MGVGVVLMGDDSPPHVPRFTYVTPLMYLLFLIAIIYMLASKRRKKKQIQQKVSYLAPASINFVKSIDNRFLKIHFFKKYKKIIISII